MVIQLRQKTTANGNSKKVNINTDSKTYQSGYFISNFNDMQFITNSKDQSKVINILIALGYKEI